MRREGVTSKPRPIVRKILKRNKIDRRIEQIDRGEVELIPAEEVFARIRERLSL